MFKYPSSYNCLYNCKGHTKLSMKSNFSIIWVSAYEVWQNNRDSPNVESIPYLAPQFFTNQSMSKSCGSAQSINGQGQTLANGPWIQIIF